jgi:hypothetical protein
MVPLGMPSRALHAPADLTRRIKAAPAEQGRARAEGWGEALRAHLAGSARPRVRRPLFESGRPDVAEHLATGLAGFARA